MALPLTTDSLDTIPEAARGAYVEREGKFHLDAEVEDVAGIKAKNVQLLGETKSERDKRKALEQEVAAMRRAAEEADLAKSGLKDVKAKWQKDELEPIAKERDAFKAKYHARAHRGELVGILGKLDVIDPDAAYRLLGDDFELSAEDALVLKADPTADIQKHLQQTLAEKYPYLVRGSQASGGSASGGKGSGGTGGKSPTQMDSTERAQFIATHGEQAYLDLLSKESTAILTTKKKAA